MRVRVGLLGLIGLVLLFLKLAEVGVVASWSWWWVLLPFWIGPALLIAVVTLSLVLAVIGYILTDGGRK